jgi:hypothetical protein
MRVRSYRGWYRHITLVLLASAFLVGICMQARATADAPAEDPTAKPNLPLIALTPSEVRHLLAHLFFPASTSVPLICQWSLAPREPINIGLATRHSSPPRQSWLSLFVEPNVLSGDFSWEFCWQTFRALFRGKLPGVRQIPSRSCCTHHTKGVVP